MAILTDATVIPLGSRENFTQSIVLIPAKAEANKPGIVCFQDVDDSAVVGEHYVWFDSAGLMRYHTSIPTDQNGSTAAIVATTTGTITLDTAYDAGTFIDGATASGTTTAFRVGASSTNKVEIYHTKTHGYINSVVGDLYLVAQGGDINFSGDNIAGAGSITGTSIELGTGEATVGSLDSTATNLVIKKAGTQVIAVGATVVTFAQDIAFSAGAEIVGASAMNIRVNAETDDYLILSATGNVPKIATTGSCNLIIAPDGDLELSPGGGDISITGTLGASAITSQGITNTVVAADFTMAGASVVALSIGKDLNRLTLGTSDHVDSYLMFDGAGNLTFYDTNTGQVTLNTLASGSLSNPTITGDLTLTQGIFTWGATNESVAGAFTFGTVANVGIQIVADSLSTGTAVQVNTDATLTSGAMFEAVCDDETNMTQGGYFTAEAAGSDVFKVGKDGEITVAGDAAETAAITVTAGDLKLADGFLDLDAGPVDGGHNIATSDDNTSATPLLTLVASVAAYDQPLLSLESAATGDIDVVSIPNLGTGYAITTTAGNAAAEGFEIICATNGTGNGFYADGTSGSWLGAATTGLLKLTSDGALAHQTASLIYAAYSGNGGATHKGTCAYLVDSGSVAGESYTMGIDTTANHGLNITTAAVTRRALTLAGPTSQTSSIAQIGATGVAWIGASNVGMLHLSATGTTAHINTSLLYMTKSGAPQNDSRGHMLRIVDTSAAAGGTAAYSVYISATGANNEALYVDAGEVKFDEKLTLTAGLTVGATCKITTNASVGGTLAVTGYATFTAGSQTAGATCRATTNGAGVGTIADGRSMVTVTSTSANNIVKLPTPTVGNVVWISVLGTAAECRSNDPNTVAINAGTGSIAESALDANSLYRYVCRSATTWIASKFSATGGESSAVAAAN